MSGFYLILFFYISGIIFYVIVQCRRAEGWQQCFSTMIGFVIKHIMFKRLLCWHLLDLAELYYDTLLWVFIMCHR